MVNQHKHREGCLIMEQIMNVFNLEDFDITITLLRREKISRVKVGYVFEALLEPNSISPNPGRYDLLRGVGWLILYFDFENKPSQEFYIKALSFKSADFSIEYEYNKFLELVYDYLEEIEKLLVINIQSPNAAHLLSFPSFNDMVWYLAFCVPPT